LLHMSEAELDPPVVLIDFVLSAEIIIH